MHIKRSRKNNYVLRLLWGCHILIALFLIIQQITHLVGNLEKIKVLWQEWYFSTCTSLFVVLIEQHKVKTKQSAMCPTLPVSNLMMTDWEGTFTMLKLDLNYIRNYSSCFALLQFQIRSFQLPFCCYLWWDPKKL